MEANDFLNMMACLREEVEQCRDLSLTHDELEALGWIMTGRYWHHSFSPAMHSMIVKFVVEYGEGK